MGRVGFDPVLPRSTPGTARLETQYTHRRVAAPRQGSRHAFLMESPYLPAMRTWYQLPPPPAESFRTRFVLGIAMFGPVMAAIRFGEVIARKSLEADPLQVTLLTMVMPVSNLAALWVGRLLSGRDQRNFVQIAGLISGVALLSGLWLESFWHLLLLFVFFFVPYTIQLTGQNRLLQQHLARGTQGGVFGLSNGFREAFAAIVSVAAGWFMDQFVEGYKAVFVAAGVFMILSSTLFASMPTRAERTGMHRLTMRHVREPLSAVLELLHRRPDFLRYEIGFMVYGFAFMATLPVVPLFLVDTLALDYTTIGFARGTLFQLTIIPSMWFFGRVFDRMPVHLLAGRVFALLALFPASLIGAALLPDISLPLVYLAFLLFGAAMGGVAVLWNISSVRFAGDEDAGVYQSVHLAATGARGLVAPLLAYLVMTVFGTVPALVFSAVLWLLAGMIMTLLHRYDGQPANT